MHPYTPHKAPKWQEFGEGEKFAAHSRKSDIKHHSIDKKHTLLHVKFELGLLTWLTRESMAKKKGYFSWGMARPVSKRRRLKNRQLFGFLNWRMLGVHDACVERVLNVKQSIRNE
jgi:hypothetical protein